MKSNLVSINSHKGEMRGKIIIAYVEPVALGHPMHCPCTISLLYVYRGIELSYYLYIPVIVNTYEVLQEVTHMQQ
jgi:hypothetical protein